MKIVIDGRMYGLKHAGIGRYVLNLVKEIEKQDKKNNYWVLLRKKYYQKVHFANPRFKKVLADYGHYSLKEQFFLPLQLIKLKPDLVHFPHFNVPFFWWGRQIVTIHDLIKHQSRGVRTTTKWPLFYWFKFLNYRFLVWLVVNRAARIIVPSQWTKTELTRRYHLPPEKIVVTYEGVDDKFKIGNLLTKYKIKKPFVIYTGSLYPHKNVVSLVRAVQKINLRLVVVCARNVFWQRFKKKIKMLKAEKLVTLAGFVPDKDLVALYQQAEAFVFPSLLEGFGLPGLEAMAVGLPVIASSSSCLPEVYGQAAVYFNPLDVGEMAKKIKKVVGNKELKSKMVKLGYQQVEKYSWQKMARETIEVYKNGSK
ncbi:MAG TPA: glycosyltransferase family 1 protein [Nevskiaceae bacterium]|nr:glycosyltransferase family 1 protein [Nevskiaceae bacterium]